MIINAVKNVTYGSKEITSKYSPLRDITLVDGEGGDEEPCTDIFNKRLAVLSAVGFPGKLKLYAAWPAAPAPPPANPAPGTLNVNQPPMVVISSNRAEWINKLLTNQKGKGQVQKYSEASTFDNDAVPWYAPLRTGNRLLYILVRSVEYGYYKQQLDGFANVHVVGWSFPYKKGAGQIGPVGFGASRFAALEMVKLLGYHKAWVVDDNVVNINGFPDTLDQVEALMAADMWGIGFEAATKNIDRGDLYGNAKKVSFAAVANLANAFNASAAGLLQQAVLWNVDLLRVNDKTMSPYFVASNEDVSFSNHLQASKLKERILPGMTIIKLEPSNDSDKNTGAAILAKMRKQLMKSLFVAEQVHRIGTSLNQSLSLFEFIKTIPNYGAVTPCQAIEQVLAIATSNKWAPKKIFTPYDGYAGIKVERLNA